MLEFKEWPKTPRLNRDMIVTEKIDGTNAAVIVLPETPDLHGLADTTTSLGKLVETSEGVMFVAAQSRKRLIMPGKQTDNAGFAQWVRTNAHGLAQALGTGYHYGEWWGKGIQSGYGLDHKRFSLFNVTRYEHVRDDSIGLGLVPVLFEGPFDTVIIERIVSQLRLHGSHAAPGQKAEGVVVFHTASGTVFKVTCEKDESPKGAN